MAKVTSLVRLEQEDLKILGTMLMFGLNYDREINNNFLNKDTRETAEILLYRLYTQYHTNEGALKDAIQKEKTERD